MGVSAMRRTDLIENIFENQVEVWADSKGIIVFNDKQSTYLIEQISYK